MMKQLKTTKIRGTTALSGYTGVRPFPMLLEFTTLREIRLLLRSPMPLFAILESFISLTTSGRRCTMIKVRRLVLDPKMFTYER